MDKEKQELMKSIQKVKKNKKQKFEHIIFEKLNREEKRMVVEAFIDKILVDKEGIEIVWKV